MLQLYYILSQASISLNINVIFVHFQLILRNFIGKFIVHRGKRHNIFTDSTVNYFCSIYSLFNTVLNYMIIEASTERILRNSHSHGLQWDCLIQLSKVTVKKLLKLTSLSYDQSKTTFGGK